VDALYAFTECESSISVNLLVIRDGKPVEMTVGEVIALHAKRLVEILTAELKIEEQELKDRLHARTLEQIFIGSAYTRRSSRWIPRKRLPLLSERFTAICPQIKREVTDDDIERLLKIPIRRISLYDINKAKKEIEEIKVRLKEIAYHLKHITIMR
jgi:topoisomerase-4 subunit A